MPDTHITAGNPSTFDPESGALLAYDGARWLRLEEPTGTIMYNPNFSTALHEVVRGKAPSDVVADRRYSEAIGDPVDEQATKDAWHAQYDRVWRYWITTPDGELPGVRDFVAAAEAGGLPEDWTEKAAEDKDGGPYTLCTFRLTMDGARSLGAEQSALMALADLPEGVFFFQTVADIDGFTGVEKESRQPTTLDTALYEPGDLFQTSHPDAAGQRGSSFGETDVLGVTDLTLT